MIYNDKYSKVDEELLKELEILEDTFNKNIEICRKDYYNGLCGLIDKYNEYRLFNKIKIEGGKQ
jgi:hypothetical protein